MSQTDKKILSVVGLGDGGQLTIPVEFRRALALTVGSSLTLVQVGDALVLAPYDNELMAVTERLEAAMDAAPSDVDDLIKAAADARAEIVREEFGEEEKP
jgi:bifunctional DNA-binding transcriptional regulator/antitoxin component of YhaV-PrlF toxin-antitoxin module